jgi:uncharacterized protein YdeI (YjbR/CyaY-like superfamily)
MRRTDDLSIKSFETPDAFREWLEKNHTTSPGLWIRYYKKASGLPSIVYKQALDEVLCFGWIDGQVKSEGEDSYLQRFTPRRSKSNWSKVNRDHVARLEREGRMRPAGRSEVERAKADGRWDAATEPPSKATLPADFVAELDKPKNKKAKAFLASLPKMDAYSIHYRLHHVKKEELRKAHIAKFIAKLTAGEPIAPRPKPKAPPAKPKRSPAKKKKG